MQYKILGDDMQAVIVSLEAGQTVMAEAGSMMYMTESIEMETKLNTGAENGGDMLGKILGGVKRMAAGESLFMTTYTASKTPGNVAFTPPYPGKIMPLSLDETGPMTCQRDAYLCSDETVGINIAFTKRLGAGLFGGEGFILQKLSGTGMAFIHSGGLIVPLELQAGQSLKVDTGCLVAMTESVTYDIQMVKGVKTALFGGEGLFYAHLIGPGRVYLQTLPFSRMADRIIAAAQAGNQGQSKGIGGIGGNILGGLISGE